MGTKRKTRSSHESLLLPIVPVNLVGAYSLPPYLPSSSLGLDCFVYSELAPVESNFWRALVQSCVRPYCLCKFSTLCGSGIVLSSHSIP